MSETIKHLETLIGRVYIIADSKSSENWNGVSNYFNGPTDYDLIDDHVSLEEGGLTLFKKTEVFQYSLHFSMNDSLDVFLVPDGFLICDGFVFNDSNSNWQLLELKTIDKIDFQITVVDNAIYIFDAAKSGKAVLQPDNNVKQEFNDSLMLNISSGIYEINKVEMTIVQDRANEVLYGILFTKNDNL